MGIILNSTPAADGFRMPGEFEEQERVWMLWPERADNWRDGALPAQKAYAAVARAIARFEPVVMGASAGQFGRCRAEFAGDAGIRVCRIESDDAWMRDVGPSFLVNDRGELRACDWTFNAWGGLVDGLYHPWDRDDAVAGQVCEMAGADRYRTEGFVLEGGSFHVDGQGTVMTTQMCLLSEGRNPQLEKAQIEEKLCAYLGARKVIWLKDGIDPEETNGHVDDVACFVRPGEAACLYTEDPAHPYYQVSQDIYRQLCGETDAAGRKLRVHMVPCPKKMVRPERYFHYEENPDAVKRTEETFCAASYLNFLIVNGGVIVPQYGDENDAPALARLREIFPEREVVGVPTREIVYGGGNIHCITQQQPKVRCL